jgi:hypothetical protein
VLLLLSRHVDHIQVQLPLLLLGWVLLLLSVLIQVQLD